MQGVSGEGASLGGKENVTQQHHRDIISKRCLCKLSLRRQQSVNLPFGDKVTAGMECILGSAMYLKSTGMSLQKEEVCVL